MSEINPALAGVLAFITGVITTVAGIWRFSRAMRRTARQDALQEWIDLYKQQEEEIEKLRTRVASLESDREQLRSRLDEAMASTVEMARLVAENGRLIQENTDLKGEVANLNRQIEGLHRRMFRDGGGEARHD